MLRGKGRYGEFAVKQLCDPYLSASEASFSQWGAIQIQLPLPFFLYMSVDIWLMSCAAFRVLTVIIHVWFRTKRNKSSVVLVMGWNQQSSLRTLVTMLRQILRPFLQAPMLLMLFCPLNNRLVLTEGCSSIVMASPMACQRRRNNQCMARHLI